MNFNRKVVIFFLLFTANKVNAQKTVTNQSLYWMRYYNQLNFNNKFTWHNEFEDRRFFKNNIQHHIIIHSRLHYKIYHNADFAVGITYSLQSPQDPEAIQKLVIPEVRPEQEINFSQQTSKRFSFMQRFRIDERFIHNNNGKNLIKGYGFNFRFRYKFQINYWLNRKISKFKTVFKIADEIMINTGKNIIYNQFDQNRIYAGVEHEINKNLSLEFGYLRWYQQKSTGYQFYNREIIRLTLYHKIKI